MELLQAGVDRTLIALWLGHESVETTQIYLDANLTIKEEALSKITPLHTKGGRYLPDDDLLAFLKGLRIPPDYAEFDDQVGRELNAKRTLSRRFAHSPGFGIAAEVVRSQGCDADAGAVVPHQLEDRLGRNAGTGNPSTSIDG